MVFVNLFSALKNKCAWRIVFCACLLALAPTTQLAAKAYVEYQVKSAFIYNFLAYTRWPEDASAQTLNLCMYGKHKFGKQINNLQGKSVNNRKITIKQINDVTELKTCQAIYFPKSVKKDLPEILSHLQQRPVLTLADTKSATSKGVMINMGLDNEKIVFDVNLGAAKTVGLNISSKLLKLAQKVL